MAVSRNTVLVALKAASGILILIWIWPENFLDRLDDILRRASPVWLLAVLALGTLQFFLAAARWRRVAIVLGVVVPFRHFLRYVYVSAFIAQVLPTSIGADAVKLWYAKSHTVSWAEGLRTVLTDRVCSLLALLAIVAAGSVVRLELFAAVPQWWLMEIAIIAFFPSLAIILFLSALPSRLHGIPGLRFVMTLLRDLRRCLASGICSDGGLVGLSLLSQIVVIVAMGLLFRASGEAADPMALFALLPLVILVSSLPISIGGWGVRELSMISIAPTLGVTDETAFAVAITHGLISILVSLPGAVLWPGAGRYQDSEKVDR